MGVFRITQTSAAQGDNGWIVGWPAIARFVGRDERTVRRYQDDATNPLAVESVPGQLRVRVLASTLLAWLERHRARTAGRMRQREAA